MKKIKVVELRPQPPEDKKIRIGVTVEYIEAQINEYIELGWNYRETIPSRWGAALPMQLLAVFERDE